MSIADEVKEWVLKQEKDFTAKDVVQAIGNHHAARSTLKWMEDKKLIKRLGYEGGRLVYTRDMQKKPEPVAIKTKGRGILGITVHRLM